MIQKIDLSKQASKIKNKENGKYPVVIIDGKVSSREILAKLSPKYIDKIEVFKGEQAIEKYNAPDGAVIITTKKRKK